MGEQDTSREPPTKKPEPDEQDKEKAAEMMEAYQERPTLILPGTGGAVSGTAVGNWLDEDGNPKYANDNESNDKDIEEQVAKDKAFNEAVIKNAKEKAGENTEASDDEKAVST
jgi:hypothetical protein